MVGKRGPHSPQSQRAQGGDFLRRKAQVTARGFDQYAEEWLAMRVSPSLGRLNVRDIDFIRAGFGKKRDRNFEVRRSARRNRAGHRRPCAFLDEYMRIGIEKLAAHRKALGHPGPARFVFHRQGNFKYRSSCLYSNVAVAH
jgi:hypothetical protein